MEPNVEEMPNVTMMEMGEDYVIVEIADESPSLYKFSYAASGESVVEEMKRLAKQGYGLAEYVNTPSVKGLMESSGDSPDNL